MTNRNAVEGLLYNSKIFVFRMRWYDILSSRSRHCNGFITLENSTSITPLLHLNKNYLATQWGEDENDNDGREVDQNAELSVNSIFPYYNEADLYLHESQNSQGDWIGLKAISEAILFKDIYRSENLRDDFHTILRGEKALFCVKALKISVFNGSAHNWIVQAFTITELDWGRFFHMMLVR